jgi:MFS family permease
LAIATNGILIVLLTIPISNMAVKWPRFETVAVAVIFSALGFGFTQFANTFPLFVTSIVIWTIGEIAATSVAPSIIADLAPVELRGLYQGVFGSAWGLSFFLGPLLGA